MRTLFMSLIYSAFIICSEGVSSGDQLLQSESQMTAPGTPVKLTCNILSHTGYWIHWIRQAPGKGLEWVGRIHPDEKTINYGTTFTGQCVISRVNSQSMVYLLINSPKTEDTAVYYCARDSRGAFDYWGAGTLVTVTSAQQSKPSVFPLVSFCRNKSDANVHIGCLATGFLPQPVVVTWNAGSSAASGAKTFPAILSPNNGLYSQSSQLSVPASEWESKTYQCLVKHTPTSSEQTVTLKKADQTNENTMQNVSAPIESASIDMNAVRIYDDKESRNPIKDSTVSFEDLTTTVAIVEWYADCGIDEYIEGDFDNLWTTAATFIVLFLMSVIYGAAVTLVKVKWFLSRLIQYELEREFITVLDRPNE